MAAMSTQPPAPASENPLFAQFAGADPVRAGDPLGFSCRGCGHLCCVNREIFLTPPEAARIIWFLLRRPELERNLREHDVRWGEIIVGASTGLPGGRLNFLPIDRAEPKRGTYCPFLSPVRQAEPGGGHRTIMHWCGIHTARPAPCRLFPVGVLASSGGAHPGEATYCIVDRCPGFQPSPPGESVPPGYAPPDARQTVDDWVRSEDDPEMRAEREHYVRVVAQAFIDAGLHASTELTPGGLLSDAEATALGREHFFRPPPPPEDPGGDHSAILEWLDGLLELIPRWLQERATTPPPASPEPSE
jgi:Fe-S-cluster containining protein